MNVRMLNDRKIIEDHFRKNTFLNLYQIGDLDDFFWKYTNWFSLYDGDQLKQIILLYKGTNLPVMLALYDTGSDDMKYLLNEIKHELPEKFYSHLSKGLAEILDNFDFTHHGTYRKMVLDSEDLCSFDLKDDEVKRLSVSDLEKVKEFYQESYPDNWFDKRMLETGKYFGYYVNGELTGISGIHVYSPRYRVAVLGNIATHPDHRGKSICAKLTSALCQDLFKTVDDIGLNVHSENEQAIKSYERVGFKIKGKL